ncbi:hypothetical protein DUNSADRAFT_13024, partial [Dunaliella salina]
MGCNSSVIANSEHVNQPQKMPNSIDTHKKKALLIDLDDCLYRNETMPKMVKEYIQRYMVNLGIPEAEVPERCAALYVKHGTTLAGLI